jgi:hypothetical protein
MVRRAELDVTSALTDAGTVTVPGLTEEPTDDTAELDEQPDADTPLSRKAGMALEVGVMRRITSALDALPGDSARHRVLDHIMDYYGETLSE